jgi:vacuolar-type H+-ATPase subunit I/STV1
MSNASITPRDIVRRIDDYVTEPHINRYYEYLMIHGEDNSEKGDFTIHARGSSALMERASQDQFLLQIGALIGDPRSEMSFPRYVAELLQSKRINPKRLKLTDEEKKEAASRQPQPAPAVQVAQIRAQTDLQKLDKTLQADQQKTQALLTEDQQKTQATLQVQQEIAQERNQMDLHRVQVDTDRDTAYVNAQREKIQADAEANIKELELRERLAMLDYANKRELTLDQVKAQLSQTAMKLQTQKELSMVAMQDGVHQRAHETVMTQVTAPPTEPAGRAENGRSYEQ